MVDALAVRRLREDEIPAVSTMLTRAFWSTPLTETISPDPARREAISRSLFASNARYGFLHGEGWVAAGADGALLGPVSRTHRASSTRPDWRAGAKRPTFWVSCTM